MNVHEFPGLSTVFNRDDERPSRSSLALGGLSAMLEDPAVSEIFVIGTRMSLERHGSIADVGGPMSEEAVLDLAFQLATAGGRELSIAQPYQTVSLDGLRIALTIPPYSHTPTISIRRHKSVPVDEDFLLAQRTLTPEACSWLKSLAHSRRSFVVTGAAGAGKTTLLRWLVSQMPGDERIVLVEEVRELALESVHAHVVSLETRPPNKEGRYGISVRDALRHALHLRPDRIGVGELRGEESLEWLLGLMTGHLGSFSTLHAASARDAYARLAWLAHTASPSVSPADFERAFLAEIPVVCHMKRSDGRRYLAEALEGGHPVILSGMPGATS